MSQQSSQRHRDSEEDHAIKFTLPTDIPGLLAIIGSDDTDLNLRKKALQRLSAEVRALAKGKSNALADALRPFAKREVPFVVSWTLLEMASQYPLSESLRSVAESSCDPFLVVVVDRLYATSWITETRQRTRQTRSIGTSANDSSGAPEHRRLVAHPLLRENAQSGWPAEDLNKSEDSIFDIGPLDEALPLLVEIGSLGARELITRRAVLAILRLHDPQRLHEVEKKQLKSLLDVIVKRLEAALNNVPTNRSLSWEDINDDLLLPRIIGPSPDVWAMVDAQRASLLRSTKRDNFVHLCSCIAVMPSMSPRFSQVLEEVPNELLVLLLATSLENNLKAMADRIRDILFQRARAGTITADDWRPLFALVGKHPELERWWQNVMSRFASEDFRQVTLDDGQAAILEFLRTCSDDILMDESARWKLTKLSAGARLEGYLIVVTRLSQLLDQTRDRMLRERLGRLRRLNVEVTQVLGQIEQSLSKIPEDLAQAGRDALTACEYDRTRLEAGQSRWTRASIESVIAAPAQEESDIVDALYRLERIDEPTRQAQQALTLRKHLLWLAAKNSNVFGQIARELPRLPSEAAAVIASVAVEQDITELRLALPEALERSPALRASWRAHLVRRAEVLQRSHSFEELLATASAALLHDAAQSLQRDIRETAQPDTWKATTSRSEEAFRAFAVKLNELIEELLAVSRNIHAFIQ